MPTPEEIVDDMIGRLVRAGQIYPHDPGNPIACDSREIAALEAKFEMKFPEAYQAYLRHMGGGVAFLADDHWSATVNDLPRLNDPGHWKSLQLDPPTELFCFATRLGDVYMFFRRDDEAADPRLFYLDDVVDATQETDMTFLGWLDGLLKDCEQ